MGSYLGPDGKHLYLLSEGTFTTIVFPPGAFALSGGVLGDHPGINPRGDIVGSYCDVPPLQCKDENVHGFLLSEGEFTTIDVPGALGTGATGINARDDIVGFYSPDASHTFGFLLRNTEAGKWRYGGTKR